MLTIRYSIHTPPLNLRLPDFQISPALRIYYLDPNPAGNPTVLLLHGLGASGASWGLQFPSLVRAGYRPIAPDTRGFGESSYPGGSMRIQILAGDMATLMEYLELDCASVVGISMGGSIALQLALDYPDKVHKLVLVNTFSRIRPGNLATWLYFTYRAAILMTLGLPAQARVVSKRVFPHTEHQMLRERLYKQILQANPWAYRRTILALARFDVRARLADLQAQTLVISGANDTTVSLESQTKLAQQIQAVNQVVIHHAGHAVIADYPEIFNRVLLDFLGG